MIWLRSLGKAVFLAIAFGMAIESAWYLFPIPLFLIVAYAYQGIEWVKGSLGKRSIGSFLKLRWNSCREGLNGLIILLFSFLIFVLIGLLSFGLFAVVIALIANLLGAGDLPATEELSRNSYDAGYELGRVVSPRSEEDSLAALFWTVAWMGVATALYRYEEWAQQRKRSRRQTKKLSRPTARKVKPAPVDPIDLELDKTRADLGLLKMKKPKKKNIQN
ncbi:hypothetical protein NG791_16815 [Laspinema sp. D1]|uniref:hypothetical protein n=1 Tax=Laspinema palackyanum TaxID=3231601 RepID=UPI00349AA513|nr:hypothetical protein [Laspinema sp. D2b]